MSRYDLKCKVIEEELKELPQGLTVIATGPLTSDSLADSIKEFMGDEETMMAGTWKVTWKQTVSRRMDTTALKKVLGDALEGYYKTIVTRPFKVI